MNPVKFPQGKPVESPNLAKTDLTSSLEIERGPTQKPSMLVSGIHPEDQLIVTFSSNETICIPNFSSLTGKEVVLERRNFNLPMQQQPCFSTSYKAGVQPKYSSEQFLDYLTYNPEEPLMYISSCDITIPPANVNGDLEGLIINPTNGLIDTPGGSNEDIVGCISNESPNHSVGSSCAAVSSLLFPATQKNSDGVGGDGDQVFYSMSASGLASRPNRRSLKISKDPRSAAQRRRQRIRQQIRTLQRLVPGGTKMDTASLLDEAVHYVKFMKLQVQSLRYLCHIAEIPPVPNFLESTLPTLYSPDYNLDQLQMSSRATTAPYDSMHLHAASYQASTNKG